MADAEVTMYLDHIDLVIQEGNQHALAALAMRLAERAQMNIRDNDQVDTGFMVNSIYVMLADGSVQGEVQQSGMIANAAGELVQREMAPQPDMDPDALAAVVVGANYAIYQEVRQSFLMRAAEQLASEAAVVAEPVYREVISD